MVVITFLRPAPTASVTMNTQDDFEKMIDANPLEASNHLVYADWLDDNGQHDEAAFRRAMGNWVGEHEWRDHPSLGTTAGYHPRSPGVSVEIMHTPLWWTIYGHYASHAGRAVVPEGVTVPPHWFESPGSDIHGHVFDSTGSLGIGEYDHRNPVRIEGHAHEPSIARWNPDEHSMSWQTYRGMEDALRRSFMASRRQQYARNVARKARGIGKMPMAARPVPFKK